MRGNKKRFADKRQKIISLLFIDFYAVFLCIEIITHTANELVQRETRFTNFGDFLQSTFG